MPDAVCINCGTSKKVAWKKCDACGFDPKAAPLALVKSVYLSIERYQDPDQRAKYRDELSMISEKLRLGEEIEYDSTELDRLRGEKELIDSVPAAAVWGAVFRFFLPAGSVIGVGVILLFILRWLKS